TYAGWVLDLTSRGNVAFDSQVNPSDFLDFRLTYKYFRSTGGVKEGTAQEAVDTFQRRLADTQAGFQKAFGAHKRFSEMEREDSAFAELAHDLRSRFTPQTHFDLGLQTAVESNQDFTAKHVTFGLQGVLDYKVWDDSDDRAKLNVFDWP